MQHLILALSKNVLRTPAGPVFQQLGVGQWVRYGTRTEFGRIVRGWLVRACWQT